MCRASTGHKASATGIYYRNIERTRHKRERVSTENELGLAWRSIALHSFPHLLSHLSACWQQRVVCRLLPTIKIIGKGCAHAQSRIFCDLFCRVGGRCLWAEFVDQGGRSVDASYLQGVKP